MKKLKITRYADGQHSWFKVSRKLLKQYNVVESDISGFSYQLGDNVYLEEDCDFAVFMKAVTKASDLSWELIQNFTEITTKYSDKSSRIRSYPRFIPDFKRVSWEEGKKVKLYGNSYTMAQKDIVINEQGQRFKLKPNQLDEIFPE